MNERGIQGILSEMRADIAGIEEDTRKQVEALREQGEENKARCMEMGNQALQAAVTNDLLPEYEQFEFAEKKIYTDIGVVHGQLVALDYNKVDSFEDIEKKTDSLCVDLSFWELARRVTGFTNTKRDELIRKLTRGIEEDDFAWYNDPENSRSTYYFVLTTDKQLRRERGGVFPIHDGREVTFPVLYLGEGFKEIEGERPGTWKTDEDRIKVEEMIIRRLGEFTEQGLIPPVSIRLYPESPLETDSTDSLDPLLPNGFVIVVEAECF